MSSIIIRVDKTLGDLIKELKKSVGEDEIYIHLNKLRYKKSLFSELFKKI